MTAAVLRASDLTYLSPGERLFIWRRRNRFTQAEAAARYHIHRETWLRAEADATTLPNPPARALVLAPTLPEALRLARRRSGLGSREAATAASMSHPSLLAAERNGEEALVAFWHARGFRGFPLYKSRKRA
jgi:hypothetical protein